MGAAHRGAVPPPVGGAPGPPGRRGLPRAVPRPARRRRRGGRRARGAPPAAVHRPAVPARARHAPASWPAWAGAARPAPAPRASRSTAASPRSSAPPSARTRGDLVAPLLARVDRLAAEERYEDAALLRDRIAVLVRAVRRRQRLESLAAVPELVLARPDGDGGWQLSVVRRGRLVAARQRPDGDDGPRHAGGPAGDGGDPRRPGRRARRLGGRDRAGHAVAGEAGHPAGAGDRHPGLRGARHRRPYSGFLARVEAGHAERDPFSDGRSLGTRARPERVAAGRPGSPASIPVVITAIVMIDAATDSIAEVAEAVAGLDGRQRGLLRGRRRRPHRRSSGSASSSRWPRSSPGGINKVPGVRRHRHPHRLPRLLPARPRGRLLHRRSTATDRGSSAPAGRGRG